jgi:aldehyde dehydrogenase (NAD+)
MGFDSGRTRELAWRAAQLDGLERFVRENQQRISGALRADLGKPALEAYTTEISHVRSEARAARAQLERWAAPTTVHTALVAQPGTSQIYRDPLGVVLIIAPWNYPFALLLSPLVGALAAGNCVVLKPSELAPATSRLMATELPRYLDSACVQLVEGAVPETTALLAERFDHIFYTGNGRVGRIVMAAAAKHLTPVTLELGGKSPAIIDERVDLEVAVRRIAWGKFVNAGQTCVAPDYLLVDRAVHDRTLRALRETIRQFYGEDPRRSPDYGRIVNRAHHRRLVGLLSGGVPVVGGVWDENDRYVAPTVLTEVALDAPVMTEEIFGPILPVIAVDGVDEAIRFVNARPKPLALYVFTEDDAVAERVLHRTSSGGAAVNHTWLHLACPALPFGGVGESGMGAYHGKHTFDRFSHEKAVLKKPAALDLPLIYPPFGPFKTTALRTIL